MSNLLELSDGEFQDKVIDSELPVLIDFWAPWCGPCRMLSPIIDELSSEFQGRIVFAKMNTDENPATPGQYNIMSIPSLLLFKDGQLADRSVGVRPKSQLKEWLSGFIDA